MRPVGWTLFQHGWCSYKKSKSRHTKRHEGCTYREGQPCEEAARGGPSAGQGEGLRGNQPCQHLDLGLPASRAGRQLLLFKLPSSGYFIMAAPANYTLRWHFFEPRVPQLSFWEITGIEARSHDLRSFPPVFYLLFSSRSTYHLPNARNPSFCLKTTT